MKILAEESKKIEDITVYLCLFKLHKSFLLLISDQPEMGIGNVTLGSPPIIEGMRVPKASYNLFGMNEKLLSTIIVERASNTLKSPVLLLLFLKGKKDDAELIKPLIKFISKVLNKISIK
ncbi:MAG: hypothetical protein ACFFCE_17860 [Promethearchaeota archaeon]